jgi:hypothetical protein
MTRFGRLSGKTVGRQAIHVWVCKGCETHHAGTKPTQCQCGRLDFDYFGTRTEAIMWAQLRLQEKRGLISDLRRQTRHKLYAHGPEGQPVEVGVYVDDASYIENGVRVWVDHKPKSGMDPLAALKLDIMRAMGKPVTIHHRR